MLGLIYLTIGITIYCYTQLGHYLKLSNLNVHELSLDQKDTIFSVQQNIH